MGLVVFLTAIASFSSVVNGEEQTSAEEKAVYVGGETCLSCHEGYDAVIKGTKHGIVFESSKEAGKGKACEACHGPGSLHVDGGGDREHIVVFDGSVGTSAMCLNCHSKGKTQLWNTSTHAEEGNTCTTCHKVHEKNNTLLQVQQPELCNQCHLKEKGEINLPSRHPVKEGKVDCSDCHDPHSSLEIEYSGSSATFKCLNCHQDKIGPFAVEHDPVAENCMACHTPHGSVNKNLLKYKQPTLCFSCHANILNDAQHPVTYKTARPSCVNACHTAIHGSNDISTPNLHD